VNWHDLTDAFATRRAVHATVSNRRDDFTVGRAEVGLAVVQTFFADETFMGTPSHRAPRSTRVRLSAAGMPST
jgi:hypothetical protein